MPRPVPVPLRQAVILRVQSGESISEIAAALRLPGRTIRSLVAQFEQAGEEGLKPDYRRCGRRRSDENNQLCEATIQLRKQHPRWGAGRIHVELTQQFPHATLPSKRTLERWLRDNAMAPAPAGRPSQVDYVRATSPHEVWQVDAGEQKKLASGKMVSWLRFVDECSGAVLRTFVFSQGHFNCVPVLEVQSRFRLVFREWGLPDGVRVDNGSPWGSPGDLPTALSLWLCGLAVPSFWNPPRQPQYNGVVERSNQFP